MTLQELKNKVESIVKIGYGQWKVTINYRGKKYSYITNNSMAVDATTLDDNEVRRGRFYTTKKKGYESLYDDCLHFNRLGIYNDTYTFYKRNK